jgi:pyrroline-5-carboxylate reductase
MIVSKATFLTIGCGNMGAAEVAGDLARQALVGVGQLLASSNQTDSELKAAVTSPGGTTQAGLSVLEASFALSSSMSAAKVAAANRAVELSRILVNEADQSVTEVGF